MKVKEFNDKISTFKDFVSQIVERAFEENPELPPMGFALVEKSDGSQQVTVLDGIERMFDSDENKQMLGMVLSSAMDEIRPMALAIVSEGWAIQKHVDDPEADEYLKGNKKPSESDEKVEVVMTYIETHAAHGIEMKKIDRQDPDKPLLVSELELVWEPKDKAMPGGRLQNILKKCYVDIEEDPLN